MRIVPVPLRIDVGSAAQDAAVDAADLIGRIATHRKDDRNPAARATALTYASGTIAAATFHAPQAATSS